MTRNYELTFIAKPTLDAANMTILIEKVKGYIANEGGTLVKTDQMGIRRLTYPINKIKDGNYVHMVVTMEPTATAKVEGRLKLLEDVIRYLLVKQESDSKATMPVAAVVVPTPTEPAAAPAPAIIVQEAVAPVAE